jgi:hypothetical protein
MTRTYLHKLYHEGRLATERYRETGNGFPGAAPVN